MYIYIYMQQFLWQTMLADVPFFDTNCKLWPQARVLDLWHRMVSARYRDAVWVNHGMEIHNWLVVSNMAILFSISYGMSSFPLTNSIIFQDGYCTTNQTIFTWWWRTWLESTDVSAKIPSVLLPQDWWSQDGHPNWPNLVLAPVSKMPNLLSCGRILHLKWFSLFVGFIPILVEVSLDFP